MDNVLSSPVGLLVMLSCLNQSSRRSLLLNLLVAIGAVLALNGLIFAFGWSEFNTTQSSSRYLVGSVSSTNQSLPGYLVGSVWIILFALMAIARWRLNAYSNKASSARGWVSILMISCWLYPFYSLAINSQIAGLLGNLETIALTIFVVIRVWSISHVAALLILPVILWVSFATVILLKDLGWL